jgi:hypothetical protein
MIEVYGAGDIEKCLIYRHPFDSRGEDMKVIHDIPAELLVATEVAADEQEVTAKLAGPPTGHGAASALGSH